MNRTKLLELKELEEKQPIHRQINGFKIAVSNSALQAIGCLGMRSCGYDDISMFNQNDLSTFNYEMHKLTGIGYAGINLNALQ